MKISLILFYFAHEDYKILKKILHFLEKFLINFYAPCKHNQTAFLASNDCIGSILCTLEKMPSCPISIEMISQFRKIILNKFWLIVN